MIHTLLHDSLIVITTKIVTKIEQIIAKKLETIKDFQNPYSSSEPVGVTPL
jgi:hypothetical protein